MSKLKQLIRTNVALTSNYKLVVDGQYGLFLESYNSNPVLSQERYKHFRIFEDSSLAERLSIFYKDTTPQIAFETRQQTNSHTVQSDYDNQFDTNYWAGASSIEDNWYNEMFEYTSPLMLDKDSIPEGFIILRTDGPGVGNLQNVKDTADSNVLGFIDQFIDKANAVRYVDFGFNTPLGKFIDKNIVSNKSFPKEPLEMNFKKFGFSKWKGIEMKNGGYCEKSFFLDKQFSENTSHFNFEEFITDGFARNQVIMPHILNFKFLFNDKPLSIGNTNNVTKRSWSINRYSGYYVKNKELVRKYTPYTQIEFKNDLYLIDNVFSSTYPTVTNVDPVLKGYTVDFKIYYKIEDTLYEVRKENDKYVLISETLFNGPLSSFNADKPVKIKYESGQHFLRTVDDEFINLPYGMDTNSERLNGNNTIQSIFILEINDKPYIINFTKDTTTGISVFQDAIINSDRLLDTQDGILSITDDIGTETTSYKDAEDGPMYFKMYRLQLCDMADLDFMRTDTDMTRYEYERLNQIPKTTSPLMWNTDTVNGGIYIDKDYKIKLNNDGVDLPDNSNQDSYHGFTIPSSSEYATDSDLFVLDDKNRLTALWNKSQNVSKWEYKNSLWNVEYPYKLNISAVSTGQYNMGPAFDIKLPSRQYNNLDWFYTIGAPRTETNLVNSDITTDAHYQLDEFDFHTLHIDLPSELQMDQNYENFWDNQYFNLDIYKDAGAGFDYFEWFFTKSNNGNGKITPVKWSVFNSADLVTGPHTLFKGAKFILFDNTAGNISNDKPVYGIDNRYAGYKFAAILTKRPTVDSNMFGKSGVNVIINNVFKNVLLCVYVYVPYNSLTSIESVHRDNFYKGTYLLMSELTEDMEVEEIFMYNINANSSPATAENREPAPMELTPQHLTLYNIISHINDSAYESGFSLPIEYTNVNPTGTNTSAVLSVETPDTFQMDVSTDRVYGERVELQPVNRLSNMENTIVYDETPKIIDSVYVNQHLVRRHDKTPLGQYYNIHRFSGPYWPLTRDINLFTRPFMQVIHRRTFDLSTPITIPSDKSIYSYSVDSLTMDTVYEDDMVMFKMTITKPEQQFEFAKGDCIQLWQEDFTVDHSFIHGMFMTVNKNIITSPHEVYMSLEGKKVFTVAAASEVETDIVFAPSIIDDVSLVYGDIILLFAQTNPDENGMWKYNGPSLELTRVHTWADHTRSFIHVFNGTLNAGGYITNAEYVYDGELGAYPLTVLRLNTEPFNILMSHYRYNGMNVAFDVMVDKFGIARDILASKTTNNPSPLQTGYFNDKYISVYPMIDEMGVSSVDINIFKSSWDDEFYNEVKTNKFKTINQ